VNRRDWESRNNARDERILAEYESDDAPSLRELGDRHGLCPQRIHQIVQKARARREKNRGA